MEKEIKVVKHSTDSDFIEDDELLEEKLDIILRNQQKIEKLIILAFVVLFLVFICYVLFYKSN
jgi:predicted nucleic acid-binding Zn ribbon protein